MTFAPTARHLLRAKDLADARYFEPLGVTEMAHAAGLSRAHFSREFHRAFGESPHAYLLTRRLERAAALLRDADRSVADICFSVGLRSVPRTAMPTTSSSRRAVSSSPKRPPSVPMGSTPASATPRVTRSGSPKCGSCPRSNPHADANGR